MAADILLETLTDCASNLEFLRDQTGASLIRDDKYWVKGVVASLNENSILITDLRNSLSDQNNGEIHSNVIDQAQTVCDTVRQAALQYNQDGLQKLALDLNSDERLRIKTSIVEPSLEHITNQLIILKGIVELIEGNLQVRDIEKKLLSLPVRDFQQVYEARIKYIQPELRKVSFSPLRRGGIQFGDQEFAWFWDTIFCHKKLYKGRTDTADGILIRPNHIEKTRQRLDSFRKAWLAVNNTYELRPSDESVLVDFVNMPKIVCVLRGCSQLGHLNTLLGIHVTDKSLEDEDLLDNMKRSMSQNDAEIIFGEFSRVRQRSWKKHSHLVLLEHEPIPLIRGRELRGSSVSSTGVFEATDAWDDREHYAHKIVLRDDYEVTRRQRLENEIKQLGAISGEKHGHHIVECAKTYRRGQNEIGMLLLPVADTDLADLLRRCSNNPQERQKNRVNLIKACGCLTYAMCYLHNVTDVRHYDVKPGNVLVHRATTNGEPVFLWADFGLAFGFKRTGFTGSSHPNYQATAAYEPPDKEFHSRAHDVYGLGCIFLEIVSVLSMEGIRRTPPVHEFHNYKENLQNLEEWIEGQLRILQNTNQKTLRKLLQLAQDMILKSREDRPKIHKVMERLRKIDSDQPFCQSCTAKIKIDLSRKPQHPSIFTHKSSGRSIQSSFWRERLARLGA